MPCHGIVAKNATTTYSCQSIRPFILSHLYREKYGDQHIVSVLPSLPHSFGAESPGQSNGVVLGDKSELDLTSAHFVDLESHGAMPDSPQCGARPRWL
jgi:hypothetical protein